MGKHNLKHEIAEKFFDREKARTCKETETKNREKNTKGFEKCNKVKASKGKSKIISQNNFKVCFL